ncbi:hypothetical protein FOPG_15193 [Fusarium oxysporum f. sp. conglutinans race 2 54008]|uniref:Rhodopsin domain-containing protein n=1 Tax=Fusarium oxysporum f. sp. conglutinans race 2 54008 TaxID=1089457 RepID=X0I652_FUSOX|nr:hypothetical protein FOPG_15193 [Fusarium oxysporum f. sp. conglutinans race 2 54008]KAI8402652.1 hypothetical protein FOFC_17968 [Fusarium oxysporum]
MPAGPSGVVVLTVIYVLISLSAIIIGARIYLRLAIQKQRLVTADWLRISAWCTAFVTGFFDILYAKEGVLHPGINYTLSNWDAPLEQQIRVRKYNWVNPFPFYTTFYLCKASLLVIYLQLFPPFMVIRRLMVWIVVVYCVCAYIVTISLQLFLCYPIQRNWSVTKPEEACEITTTLLLFQINWVLHFVGSIARKFAYSLWPNSGVPSMSTSVSSSAASQLSDHIFTGKESTTTSKNQDALRSLVMRYAGQARADLKR